MRKRLFIYPLLICALVYVIIYQTFSSRRKVSLPYCAEPPYPVELPWWTADRFRRPSLNFTAIFAKTMNASDNATNNLPPGGHWRPPYCKPRHNIGILVPYRNRPSQLKTFIDYMHPFLQRQNLAYTIYIVEQTNASRFNRGMLFNIGFVESKKLRGGHDCYYFHDVDMLPENYLNQYNCPKVPRHQCAALDKYNYSLHYQKNFGGVTSIKAQHFELVNGFSNLYFGWGSEDDDFFDRVRRRFNATRLTKKVGSYAMMKHVHQPASPHRTTVYKKISKVAKFDGLNSLCYHTRSVDLLPKYTRILADFNETYQINKGTKNSTLNCQKAERYVHAFLKTV